MNGCINLVLCATSVTKPTKPTKSRTYFRPNFSPNTSTCLCSSVQLVFVVAWSSCGYQVSTDSETTPTPTPTRTKLRPPSVTPQLCTILSHRTFVTPPHAAARAGAFAFATDYFVGRPENWKLRRVRHLRRQTSLEGGRGRPCGAER